MINANYFIVLDRNPNQDDQFIFNVSFFYLKSQKKDKLQFSYVKTPFFRGEILFGLEKTTIRPLKFEKIQTDDSITPINPKLFKRFILAEENKFIAFSDQSKPEDINPIIEMLKNFQISRDKILTLTFCKSCLEKKTFTLLNNRVKIKSLQDNYICPDCALDLVLKNAVFSGLISNTDVDPKLKNFFRHLILKFKDVKKVLSYFKSDFNPANNMDITLYDKEENQAISKKYLNYKIEHLEIPKELKEVFKRLKIETLLPIQAISVEQGLIDEHLDQLIMSPTSSGKTLVGELAGISRLLENRKEKMVYLVPIVALANLRTQEFTLKYSRLSFKIVKKIGESLLEPMNMSNLEDLREANIIIGTYEAIDYILRSGNKEKLGEIGTIVIDEIQTLIEPERGFILDGLISRLKFIYPKAQFLYLSATIGQPMELAKKLNAKLIQYNNRPVPIERHLLLCLNDNVKKRYMLNLVRSAFSSKSNYGFKGQSIIFTNSRKNCENLSQYFQKRGLQVRAYHSGLSHEERKHIELEFQAQSIAGVVATAALAAGVDLPAQIVIFESLTMGIKILTVAEFEQMLGRAGRLKKHEIGYVYLLVEPGKTYSSKQKETEDEIAIKLLNGKIRDFELDPDEDHFLTELLAFISMGEVGMTSNEIFKFYNNLINNHYDTIIILNNLIKLGLISKDGHDCYKSTEKGKAIARSFLTVQKCMEIINLIKDESKKVIDIALELKPIKNVYLSKKVVANLSKNINMKYFSNNFFSASVLSLMDAEKVKKRKKFSQEFIEYILKWTREIFNCTCKDKPYCDCGRLNFQKILLKLRIEDNLSVEDIQEFIENDYKILVFRGDLIDYYENLIYSLESIKYIVQSMGSLNKKYKEELQLIPSIIEKIKNVTIFQ